MRELAHNIRFYVLIISGLLGIGIYFLVGGNTVKLQQIYALTAVAYLYITLLAGPLCYTFKRLPYRSQYLKARRGLGVSTFFFALAHSLITFFGGLGGFSGLGFLNTKYLVAVTLGFVPLLLLSLLAGTSFDYLVDKLTFPKWKLLHRSVYLAGILILIHAMLLGTHFSNLSGQIPQSIFVAVSFLLLLEAPRLDKYMVKLFPTTFSLSFVVTAIILSGVFFTIFNPFAISKNTLSLDIHATHKQQALAAQQNPPQRRYTVSFLAPDYVTPNRDVTLTFKVTDAANGNPVSAFKFLYSKLVHMVVVDSTLTYFAHIHPVQKDNGFTITTRFPQTGMYHMYLNFEPVGGGEQQFAFTLPVGVSESQATQPTTFAPDSGQAKVFGNYEVSVNTHGPLSAPALSLGKQTITFTLLTAKDHAPVTNLKPYLEAFGHLTLINIATFEYVHVHPYSLEVPPPDTNSGPTVDFQPIGIYGPIKPGLYRAFSEFNPDNKLFTAEFTLKIE